MPRPRSLSAAPPASALFNALSILSMVGTEGSSGPAFPMGVARKRKVGYNLFFEFQVATLQGVATRGNLLTLNWLAGVGFLNDGRAHVIQVSNRKGTRSMAVYALWNNKGGVGKSYLTFQIACEYARTHPDRKVLVIDLCPQASNASSMLLGGMVRGKQSSTNFLLPTRGERSAGYVRERLSSPYHSPGSGVGYLLPVRTP